MNSLFDKLRPNTPQYGLGAFSQAISPLDNLLQARSDMRQKRQNIDDTIRGLQGIGFAEQEAQSLASLPEPVLQTVLKGLSQRGYTGGMQSLSSLNPEQQLSGQDQQQVQAPSIRNVLASPTLREQREDKKLDLKEKQVNNQEIRNAYKDTAPFRNKILQEKSSAQSVLDDLERMKELETGNAEVDTPGYIEFLERSGFNIPALMRPESEEFNKLRQSQLRDAKQYFGGRVSNFEMDQFLKSIPSLNQSPEGRKRVIANMERINKLKVRTAEVMRDIIKQNKGIPPLDLDQEVEERMSKEREKIAKEFIKDLDRKVPQSQSQYVTALQAILGDATAGLGRSLSGAAKGAALGALSSAFGGPIGVLGGAGLGALGGLSGILK